MEIQESSNYSTFYGLTVLSVVVLFLGLLSLHRFAPPPPQDYSVNIQFDSRDYPGGFVSIKTYENLMRRYEKAKAKLPKKDQESDDGEFVISNSHGWELFTKPQ